MHALLYPYVLTGYLTCIVTLAVGIFVFMQKRHSAVHRSFLIFSASIAQWSCFTAVHAMQQDPAWALFWAKFCHIGAMLIPVFFYYFTLKITGKERKVSLIMGFAFAALLIVLNFLTPLFIPTTRTDVGVPHFTKAGPFYFLMIIFFSVYVLLSLVHLWNEFRHSTGTRKKHIQYFFYASLVGFTIGGVNFCPVYGIMIPPYPYSAVCGAIYSCVIAYAILKHKLFDIELIVKKGIVFGVLFGAVYITVSAFIFLIGYLLAKKPLPLLSGISIALAMFLYEPLKGLLTGLTNRFLYQKKMAYTLLIQSLTDRLANVCDEQTLAEEIVYFLTDQDQMALEWAALYLRKQNSGHQFKLKASKGNSSIEELGETPIVNLISKRKSLLIISPFDVEGDLEPEIKAKLRQEKIEAIVPILVEEELYGILLLGKKKSDDGFLPEDESLLLTLMEEVSMLFLSGKLLKETALSYLELGQRSKMAAITKLAGGVHHEVRNPLHALSLDSKTILSHVREGVYQDTPPEIFAQEVKDRTLMMLNDIERIKNSLGRFAHFARPDQDGPVTSLRLCDEVEKFIALMREGQKLDKITVKSSVASEIQILASSVGLQEILFHLLSNAYDAMKGEGEFFIKANGNGDFVELKICDTGPGIAEEILPNIFDDYFTTKTNTEATGLGLSITRQRIEQFGGSIDVSQAKEGAEFILRFRKPLCGVFNHEKNHDRG